MVLHYFFPVQVNFHFAKTRRQQSNRNNNQAEYLMRDIVILESSCSEAIVIIPVLFDCPRVPTHRASCRPSQVLCDTWSVIVTVDPEAFLVTVAPFEGMQASAYGGEARIDSRDLYYDPRGWWCHVPAIAGNASGGSSRLHRQSRGLSASGLPRGAGSLNEALEEGEGNEVPQILNGRPSGGDREVVIDWSRQYTGERNFSGVKGAGSGWDGGGGGGSAGLEVVREIVLSA